MESNYEKAYNILKEQKENEAKIQMIKDIEKINQLKRENRYFDNSISSELYNQVTEAVDTLADNLYENENEQNLNFSSDNNINSDNYANNSKRKGMQIKKKLMVDNLMEMRENTIKMSKMNLEFF